ncbi:MAG: phage tail tape measure protein [Muribaculaceae bacterium]|nr:phage tail tape measure protein [Muribaculaceae bacterium]
MSNYTTNASVNLNVNGKEAEETLAKLKQRASDYRDAIAKAAKEGNKTELKRLRKELTATEREIKSIQTATINVADVLKRLDSATPKELRATLKQLTKELEGMERGTKAWDVQAAKIARVKGELDNVRSAVASQRSGMEKFTDWLAVWQTSIFAIMYKFSGIVSLADGFVQDFAEMDSALANTQKFTGMMREEVELLNEEFKKMDTRTSRVELNELAAAAGRLGKNTVDDVLGFVRAADVIGVAMDELGAEAPQVISQLAGIFNLEGEMGTEQAMLSVGSAINTLSQNCAASAPNLVDFAGRLGAIANSTNMSMDEMLAFGALLDDQKVSIEKSSTAIQGVITKMYADPAGFARKAGMDVNAFSESLKRSSTEGLLMFIDSLSQMDQMGQASTLKELGTAGAGVTQTFQTLAGKTGLLKTQMQTARKAFDNATSATEEYNEQNNTVQARLDKATERVAELRRELGERLLPVVEASKQSEAAMMEMLVSIVGFLVEYKGVLVAVTAAVAAYSAAVNWATITTKAHTVWLGVVKTAQAAWTATIYAGAGAVALFSGNVARATAAFRALSIVLKLSPIGLAAAAITAVAGGLLLWTTRTKEAVSAQKALNKIRDDAQKKLVDEKTKIEFLVSAAKNETLSLDARKKAIDKLNSIIPNYNARLDETSGKYKENKKALDAYLLSLAKKYEIEGAKEMLLQIGSEKAQLSTERATVEQYLETVQKRISSQTPRPQTSGGATAPGSYHEAIGKSAEIRSLEAQLDRIDDKLKALEAKKKTIEKLYGEEIVSIAGDRGNSDYDETGGDDPDGTDGVAGVKKWRDKEIAIARAYYAVGVTDYETYRKRLADIDVEYYDRLCKQGAAGSVERLNAESDYWEAVKKREEEGVKLSVDGENRRYDELAGVMKKRLAEGQLTQEGYDAAMELLELEHLRRLVQCHEEGGNERLSAESRYYDALIAMRKKRGTEWVNAAVNGGGEMRVSAPDGDGWQDPGNDPAWDAIVARSESLRRKQEMENYYMDEVFGLNADNRQLLYDENVEVLKAVYAQELVWAKDNAEERLRIEETFFKALKDLQEKYKPGRVAADTPLPTENPYIEQVKEFGEWLESDGGQALTQTFELVNNSLSGLFGAMSSIVQAELEIQTASIEKRYDKEIARAEGNSYKIAKLEEKKEKEIAKAKSEASKKQFAMQVIQTIGQTAIAGLNAYSSTLAIPLVGPALAPAAMALAIATGMLQVVALKKQQQAAAAQGYASGGFTPEGGKYEPAGIVHKGEWVASQELLASPVARPMIEALDYAQRTNTIGSLRGDDVSRSVMASTVIASSSDGNALSESLTAQAVALAGYAAVIGRLNERLDEPFVTVNTVTGDAGIKKAQDDYDKLIRNKTPKSKRKNT